MSDIRIVTANVDFALRPAQVAQDLERIIERADIITFQEAKQVDLDRLIRDKDWEVYQPMATDATKGSAVAWRKSVATVKARGKRIGTRPHGRAILTRYIVWVRLRVDGAPLVVASVHLPPKRFWGFIYDLMISNIAKFIAGRNHPILVGGDWNKIPTKAPDILGLARRFGGSTKGIHIDGFLLIPRDKWRFSTAATDLFNTNSDHDPVQVKITRKKS